MRACLYKTQKLREHTEVHFIHGITGYNMMTALTTIHRIST